MLVALVVYGEPLHLEALVAAIAVGVIGVTLCFAALQVFVRDVAHAVMPALTILMYLTPNLCPLKLVSESRRPWVAINPFTWPLIRLRDALIEGRLTPEWGDGVAVRVAVTLFLPSWNLRAQPLSRI